jgi:hypothetical protein
MYYAKDASLPDVDRVPGFVPSRAEDELRYVFYKSAVK